MNLSKRALLAQTGALAAMAATASCASAPSSAPSNAPSNATRTRHLRLGAIERIDAGLDQVVDATELVEDLGAGIGWAEGPVWFPEEGGFLLFTDVPGNTIYKWQRQTGIVSYKTPSGFDGPDASHLREGGANGLARSRDGQLVYADTGNRAIAKMEFGAGHSWGRRQFIAERYDGKRFNSPNDVALAANGGVFFTDPCFGLKDTVNSPLRELTFAGVFFLAPDGNVRLIDDQLSTPNGIALSPDQRTLFVTNCDPANAIVRRYHLDSAQNVIGADNFTDMTAMIDVAGPGWPDGMKLDTDGRLYVCGPGGVSIYRPDGKLLGRIRAGRAIANCNWGEDGKTLFLAAHEHLGAVRLKTTGVR